MPTVSPDTDRDGAFSYVLNNGNGLSARISIQSGASPKLRLQTAGFGIEVLSAAGAVIFTIAEDGTITPTGGIAIPARAGAPAGGSAAQFYRDSSNGNTLMYFDGTTAYGVALVP